ncbi:MAG: DegV family protein [Lachnospiraceae bacterium]|nr:DegV family protein [Lachnospiraceae bacterium]
MSKIAIVTDSNSGITRSQAEKMGVYVLSMPFYINEKMYLEGISLTQEEFYEYLKNKADISTSMPSVGDVTDLWDELLKSHDEILHIPMSSGLSGSCETAMMLAQDYDGKVHVVNNRRISVTQKQSVQDAAALAEAGWSAPEIKKYLEETQYDSTIYITLDTLYYLKKGGRITPAAAALGTLLRLKPVLQIQGEKLDAYAKSRTLKAAKATMLEAIEKDNKERFHGAEDMSDVTISLAYSGTDLTEINTWRDELREKYPHQEMIAEPLSLSVACHIGPGAVAITCTKNLPKELLTK